MAKPNQLFLKPYKEIAGLNSKMTNGATLKLRDVIEQFMDELYAGKENTTPAGPKKRLKLFANFLGGGDRKMAEVVNVIDLEKFKLYLQKRETKYRGKKEVKGRLSPFYIRGILINARCFVQWLHKKKFTKRNLAENFVVPPMPQPHPKPVMEKDVKSLIKAADRSPHNWKRTRDKAIIQTFRASGGRVGGLVSANIDNCDLRERHIIVVEKGNIQRAIFLSPIATKAVRVWLKEREKLKPKDNALFIGGHGRRLTTIGISHTLAQLSRLGGTQGPTNPHAFRHGFARDTLKNGADIFRLSRLMGHKGVAVTAQYYIHWDYSDIKESHQKYNPHKKKPKHKRA